MSAEMSWEDIKKRIPKNVDDYDTIRYRPPVDVPPNNAQELGQQLEKEIAQEEDQENKETEK